MKFSYHLEAEQELLHTINYYENKTAGLGNEFLLEVEKTIDLINSRNWVRPLPIQNEECY